MSEEQINQTSEEVTYETEVEDTTQNNPADSFEESSNEEPDYKTKFSESSKEAQRLYKENKEMRDKLEKLLENREEENKDDSITRGDAEELYPGFNSLPEDEKKNLLAYTNSIKASVLKEINNDPSISYARQQKNERDWEQSFEKMVERFPDLKEHKSGFKSKYFKSDKPTPSNIDDILEDASKAFLFDKAQDLGARKAKEESERMEIARTGGGDKTPKAGRTLEDWNRIARTNPGQFAKLSKEFKADLESGKLK